jgi:hypothetical protein
VLASILLASIATSATFAEEAKPFSFGLEGNNLIFSTVEEAKAGGSFRLAIRDGERANISVKLVDIVSNSSGFKQAIELNSSPFTPNGLVSFPKSYPAYAPSTEIQYFDIDLKFKDGAVLDRPVLGGISVSLVPEKKNKKQFAAESAIVATFAYIPATGINIEEYSPGLTLTGPAITRVKEDILPLNLIPNLPFLTNHGDLTLNYKLQNTGKIFLETVADLKVQQLGFLGETDKMILSDSQELFMVPDQFSEQTILVSPSDTANRNLGIGIYRFDLTATGKLGDQIDTSASNQQLLIIFPWKQSLLALGVLILVRRRIYRALKSVFDLLKAFRDFLRSRNQRPAFIPNPRSAAPVLVTTSSRVATNSTLRPLYVPTATANKATATDQIPEPSGARPLYPYWYQPPTNGS